MSSVRYTQRVTAGFKTLLKILECGLICLLSLAIPAIQGANVQITSPAGGSTVVGAVTLAASAPGAATVDYWIAGHSIISNQLPTAPPYQFNFDTVSIWDGPVEVVAVSRDQYGNITGLSQPLKLIVQNGSTRAQLNSPDVTGTLSGLVTWRIQASDPRGIQAFVYSIDGKETPHPCLCGTPFTDEFQLDTRALSNGVHYFVAQIVPNNGPSGKQAYGSGQVVTQFTVNNGSIPLELKANIRQIYFQPGQGTGVQLSPAYLYTDGVQRAASGVSFSIDHSSVASVNASGFVTAGPQQGYATVTMSGAGLTASIYITNMTSHSGFPHFTRDGHIVYSYDAAKSLWVRTLFNTNTWPTVMNTPGFATAAHQAGINAVTSNFFMNPADNGIQDFQTWKVQDAGFIDAQLAALKSNQFSLIGTGDDFQRSPTEANFTLTSPWAGDAARYTMNQLMQSGLAVSIEMEDEVGGTTVPQTFQNVMSVLNTAPTRPPVTWQVAGLQGAAEFAAWEGNPAMSDYASMYWAYPGAFRPEFSWGYSLQETRSTLERSILGKLASIQIDRPRYMETHTEGNAYFKRVDGDFYHPGQDELAAPGFSLEQTTAQIMYAAAMGFAGVRTYAYDGASGVNDALWSYYRAHDPAGPFTEALEQTGSSPFSKYQEVKDRWNAMSNAFNLIQSLEPYLLSPQINAVDADADVITGARELSGGAGRILIAINLLDNVKTASVDLSSYRYANAASVTRHHLAGLLSTSETVPNDVSEVVTFAPGEAMVWVFTPSANTPPPVQVAAPPSVAITSPASNQKASGTMSLAATVSAGAGVSTVQFSLDGQNLGSTLTGAPYALSLDTAKLSNGSHTVSATASDALGRQASAPQVSFTIDNQMPTVVPAAPMDGLIADWTMNEGSGNFSADSSGNYRSLWFLEPAIWLPAPSCKLAKPCVQFNGTQSALAVVDLSATKTVTVAFWMNIPAYANNDGLAMEFSSHPYGFNSITTGFIVDPNSSQRGGGYFEAGLRGDAGYNDVIFNRPTAGTWHHYTFVFDKSAPANTQVIPYVDGAAVPYTKIANAANSNTFGFDALNVMARDGAALFGTGSLQDVRIYGRALKPAEVAGLALYGTR